jgi:hypothetical protein
MRAVVLLALTTGCYAGVGAGYYPSIQQTVTDPETSTVTEHDTSGWAASFRLGFYLDFPIPPLRTGLGLGWSPDSFGGDPVLPGDAPADVTAKGSTFRADLTLPFVPFTRAPAILPRLTAIYTGYTGAGIRMAPSDDYVHHGGGSGSGWFLGATLGPSKLGGALLASIGYQRVDCTIPADPTPHLLTTGVATRASGFGVRVLFNWTPTAMLLQHWVPSKSEPQQRGNAGCYYSSSCDVDGNCKSQYVCP